MNRFEGRVAIVTGGSRGIGYGVAKRLVAEGARVCITARNAETLDEAAASLGDRDRVIAVAGHTGSAEHRASAIAATVERFGRVDMLVNNTGINPVYGPLVDLEESAAQKIFATNVLAPLGWTREVLKAWMGENGGSIVNVSSASALVPSPNIGMYGISKAAVLRMTTELAVELAPRVRVNAVAPAVVKTAFAAELYAHDEAAVAAGYPLNRLGVPADVAGAVAYLLSDDAGWVTGQNIVLDGGLTQRVGG